MLEHVSIEVELGERCPLLLCRAAGAVGAPLRPVFVLHGTGKSLADLLHHGHLQRFARRGMLAVGVDARHHGARARAGDSYWAALTAAWRAAGETGGLAAGGAEVPRPTAAQHRHPFIWDTVWDLMRALDWLEARPDVDCSRVGATGISLGGMMAWCPHPRPSPLTQALTLQPNPDPNPHPSTQP